MRIVVTGANTFLGWHLRARLHALTDHVVIPVDVDNWDQLAMLLHGADVVVHLAGINRAPDREVEEGNRRLASELADAVRHSSNEPTIVYANSVQAGNGTPDGDGKAQAAVTLERVAREVGAPFANVLLPSLFGEHGRPPYNSFVATFAQSVAAGERPQVQDRDVELLHVQDAAQALIDCFPEKSIRRVRPAGTETTVATVLDILKQQYAGYQRGEIPALPSRLNVNLFNTLRAAMFPVRYPIPLVCHTDNRGNLVEAVRAHGSEGQTFFSTTAPGVTRGQHFHLRKVERFVVVGGQARIALRRVLTGDVVSFDVNGDEPAIVDMPTLWVHSITNTGDSPLATIFWTNELFDPEDTDTHPEAV